MIDIQTAVNSLMTLLLSGGAEAAIELSKNVVIGGVKDVSKLWRNIFSEQPESYPLANQVAKRPEDESLQQQLRVLLEKTLSEHPELIQDISIESINIDKVEAKNGSIAVGVNIGGKISH